MELLHERYQHFRVHPVRRAANDELHVPPQLLAPGDHGKENGAMLIHKPRINELG